MKLKILKKKKQRKWQSDFVCKQRTAPCWLLETMQALLHCLHFSDPEALSLFMKFMPEGNFGEDGFALFGVHQQDFQWRYLSTPVKTYYKC